MTEIFHLSLPVSNLQSTRQFYEKYLGGKTGRVSEDWLDLWLFGVQITIQQGLRKNSSLLPTKFHFGGTLTWEKWKATRARLAQLGAEFEGDPVIDAAQGRAKMYLKDPDGYVIELKAYKDIQHTLRPPA